jgi:YegS/Rv2252/BmrU family lipid kinase
MIKRSLEEHGFEFELLETKGRGDAETSARESRKDIAVIVAIGGDGTVSETIAGLAGRLSPVCIVPVGTANCLANELGQTARADEVHSRLEHLRTETMDSFLFNGRHGALMAGAGLDGEVGRVVCSQRKGTLSQLHYYWPSLMALVNYPFYPFSLKIDGRKVSDEATFVEIANVRQYGGPLILVAHAERSDGLLDVLLVEKVPRWRYARHMAQSLFSKRVSGPDVKFFRGRHIVLEQEAHKVPYQVDGDFMGYLPLDIKVVPASVKIVVNPD